MEFRLLTMIASASVTIVLAVVVMVCVSSFKSGWMAERYTVLYAMDWLIKGVARGAAKAPIDVDTQGHVPPPLERGDAVIKNALLLFKIYAFVF
jgi:hypothetical protein